MNNSSVYNNLLLKTVQAPAVQSPAPKRNFQEDQTSASFQQSFKDAHESVRTQDEKVAKPAAKKTAAADNRKPANDVEKKPSTPAKHLDENRPSDQVDERDASADKTENAANQNPDSNNASTQHSDGKNTVKKVAEEDEPTTDSAVADIALMNPLVATPQVVPPAGTIADTPDAVVAAKISAAATSVGSTTETLTNSVTDEAAIPEAVVAINSKAGVLTSETDNPVSTAPSTTEANKNSTITEIDTPAGGVQPLTAELAVPQAAPAVAPEVIAEQVPIVAAALGAVVLPKPVSTQSVLAPAANDVADTDVLSAIASPLANEAPSPKTLAANTPDVAAAVASALSPEQALDPKATFEKTLQNLERPATATRDECLAVPASTSSTVSSTTNALDSMMRFSDAQTPAARSFVVQTAVPVPVGQPQWSQAVGEKVLWLAAQNVSSAEIHLNPENLGPMQVKVSVNQEQATINFTSHHAVVREVLDQNLGRLRDMFSEQGLNLVNVDVSDKSFSRQQGEAKEQKGQAGNNDLVAEEEPQVAVSAITQQRLVDHYA